MSHSPLSPPSASTPISHLASPRSPRSTPLPPSPRPTSPPTILPYRFPTPPNSPPRSSPPTPIPEVHVTPSRSDSLPLRSSRISPRQDSLARKPPPPLLGEALVAEGSTRLGQASFDRSLTPVGRVGMESVASPTGSPSEWITGRFQPRKLFAEEIAGNESSDLGSPSSSFSDEKAGDPLGANTPNATDTKRPAKLDFTPNTPMENVRFSTTDSTSEPPTPAAPSDTKKRARVQPTIALLFSLNTRATQLAILTPAAILSIITGLAPAVTSKLMGWAFGEFASFTSTQSTVASATAAGTLSPDAGAALLDAAAARLKGKLLVYAGAFLLVAGVILVTWTASTMLWTINGERTATSLRKEVYKGITSRGLAWFDLGMGMEEEAKGEDAQANGEERSSTLGAGGLMGQFNKSIDDARLAANATCGLMLQYATSFFSCLILALYSDWRLTLVILSSVPVLVVIVSVTEMLNESLLARDRLMTSSSASKADRVLGAITTIKAFNAEDKELREFQTLTDLATKAYIKLHVVWGVRTGLSQFLLLAMFVSGFWFGSWLVQTGRTSAGTVQTCFWAALLATTYVQITVPLLVILEKGKIGMASILELAREMEDEPEPAQPSRPTTPGPGSARPPPTPFSPAFSTTRRNRRSKHQRLTSGDISRPLALQGLGVGTDEMDAPDDFKSRFPDDYDLDGPRSAKSWAAGSSPVTPGSGTPMLLSLATAQALKGGKQVKTAKAKPMSKLRPATFSGELALRNVTFHYPSRPAPAPPALRNVSLYLAPSETTYIVGGSGSGKSTVGSLLLALYRPDAGRIEVDEQGLEWIDDAWLRGHVACVSQGASVLFDGSVHDNVAIGVVGQIRPDGTRRAASDVSREEVVEACKGALIHDFVSALPQGYDTWLSGEKGAALSGGQRQRLAIARAWCWNPTVLILDEATSALDAVSRHLVAAACKRWRKHKTTIIITHDLTPIEAGDFVYVMADGAVVEQGYKADLEANCGGPWHSLAHSLDRDAEEDEESEDDQEKLQSPTDEADPSRLGFNLSNSPVLTRRSTTVAPFAAESPRPASLAMQRSASAQSTPRLRVSRAFEASALSGLGLTDDDNGTPGGSMISAFARASRDLKAARRVSARMMERSASSHSLSALTGAPVVPPRTPPRPTTPLPARGRPVSTIYTPDRFGPGDLLRTPSQSPVRYRGSPRPGSHMSTTTQMELAGEEALSKRRADGARRRIKHESIFDDVEMAKALAAQLALAEAEAKGELGSVVVHDPSKAAAVDDVDHSGLLPDRQISMWQLCKMYYPTIPNKSWFWLGVLISIIVGACTPVFSMLLSKLMTGLGTSSDSSQTTKYSLFVLLVAAVEGSGTFGKFIAFEACAMRWVAALRMKALGLVLRQDKAFFDRPENSTTRLVQILIKDHEDARTMVGTILGQFVVIFAMVAIGILWAMTTGWQLTLVGLGLAPVFVVATSMQAQLLQKLETRNRILRQELGFKFHSAVSNVRAIRAMSIEPKFEEQFDRAAEECFQGAKQSAAAMGFGAALGAALTYLAEAIMFYVGAVLVAEGKMTYGEMNETFSLFIFAVTFAMALMTSLPGITKSHRALVDLTRVLELGTDTAESEGRMTFPIEGEVRFEDVRFAYPARPDVEVLHGVSFAIRPGQCVGFVGPSGSGKSTIAALLQRLYEPSSGRILLDGRPLGRTDVKFLRDHLAIVSQHPALFDSSVSANIGYGLDSPEQAVIEHAARQAHADDFVRALPNGYNTLLGENASLISGGQAQRLQIARALVRPRELLVLDECTSALDQINQELVMDTIREVKKGRTTLVVTHKLAVMEMCDVLVVIDGGNVVEVGTAKELRAKQGGVFAKLAGEWEH